MHTQKQLFATGGRMHSKNKPTLVNTMETFDQIEAMCGELVRLQRVTATYVTDALHGGSQCIEAHEIYALLSSEITERVGAIARAVHGTLWTVHIEGWCPSDPVCYGYAWVLVRRAQELQIAYTVTRC
jgi:hypothetical protein